MPGIIIFILVAGLAFYLFTRDGSKEGDNYSSRNKDSFDPAETRHTDFGTNNHSADFHHTHHSHSSDGNSSDSLSDFESDSSFDSGSDFSSSDSTSSD